MKILSRVCAEFKDRKGNVIFRIGPADRRVYLENVPEAIQEDLLFRALLAEGSIDVVETAAQKKAAEQDPMAGADATGKKAVKARAEIKADARAETKAEANAAEVKPDEQQKK